MRKNKCLFCCVMASLIVLAIFLFRAHRASGYRLEVMSLSIGAYGYRILCKERTVIYQPFIPVLPGKQSFRSEEEARRVGQLVLQRVESGGDFVVTLADLRNLGIGSH